MFVSSSIIFPPIIKLFIFQPTMFISSFQFSFLPGKGWANCCMGQLGLNHYTSCVSGAVSPARQCKQNHLKLAGMIFFRLAGRPWDLGTWWWFAGVNWNADGMQDWKLSRRFRDKHLDYKMNHFKFPGRKTWKSPTYPPVFIRSVSFTNQQSFATITCREYFLQIQPSIKILH